MPNGLPVYIDSRSRIALRLNNVVKEKLFRLTLDENVRNSVFNWLILKIQ